MGTPRRAVAVVFALGAAVLLRSVLATPSLPPDPHLFMQKDEACTGCHQFYRDQLDPHTFVVPITEQCMGCHPQEKLGRSHPVGVNPVDAIPSIDVPEDLPLENELISCGTCHQPHLTQLSALPCSQEQAPFLVLDEGRVEKPYYKAYYLRFPDPEAGFAPLCMACHRDY